MTDIAHQLPFQLSFASLMTSTLSMIFHLPEIMSWMLKQLGRTVSIGDEDEFRKILKSSDIITVLEGRTRCHPKSLSGYDSVRCQVKLITMNMFSTYYALARQLRFQISRLRLKQSPRLFHPKR